ncbi:hypothetical protein [uncultured Alsobacter sp.]|uniref:hypothetical protein n=1 Tax=uncultured Alsobacter sp. TaxID=1748258 RepID=UPI0025CDC147|nr:hypothetical protein [uncultured Alsobacter sp.]
MPVFRPFIENFPWGSNRGSITPQPPGYVDHIRLSANTPKRYEIPAGAKSISFSADGDFYALYGGSSVVTSIPSDDVTDGSAAELNPMARRLPDGITHISLVAPAATRVTISAWS